MTSPEKGLDITDWEGHCVPLFQWDGGIDAIDLDFFRLEHQAFPTPNLSPVESEDQQQNLTIMTPSAAPKSGEKRSKPGVPHKAGTRRPSSRYAGNNRHGKKGKPRCKQCRAWKLKCEYSEMESPCTQCVSKGLICGDKILANEWKLRTTFLRGSQISPTVPLTNDATLSITRSPPRPADQILNVFEETHVRSIRERNFLFKFTLLQFPRTDGHHLWENLFRRFGPILSSKSVRYGCILYSLYKHQYDFKSQSLYHDDHLLYLNHFYRATSEAITAKRYEEVVYACFAVCMYGIRLKRHFEEVVGHARGLRLAVENLMQTSPPIGEELFFLECMWEKVIWIMGEQWLFKTNPSPRVLVEMQNLGNVLWLSEYRDQQRWVQDSFVVIKLKFQFLRFTIALHQSGTAGKVDAIKDVLVMKFYKHWRANAETLRDQPSLSRSRNRTHLRTLAANLWSEFLELLLKCGVSGRGSESSGICRKTLEIISSIHSLVAVIPSGDAFVEMPLEGRHAVDIAVDSLALVGLVLSERYPMEVKYLELTRTRIVILAHDSGRLTGDTILSAFDQACRVVSSYSIKWGIKSQIIDEWIRICN